MLMNKIRTGILLVMALLVGLGVSAQEAAGQTDVMRSNGKIYVVMAVVVTILVGLFAYVFALDRKISKLEK